MLVVTLTFGKLTRIGTQTQDKMKASLKLTIRQKTVLINQMAALAHDKRLSCFLLIVAAGTNGMPATKISERLRTPKNTMSAQLKVLEAAGLIIGQKDGRNVYYRAIAKSLSENIIILSNVARLI